MKALKIRLILMNFLEFAVWGAYLTCIGNFLGRVGLGDYIPWFYIAQGIVSIFMPAIMGALADKHIQPQRLLGICHLLAAIFMLTTAYFGYVATQSVQTLSIVGGDTVYLAHASIWTIFIPYCLSVAFFMPTIALANTTAFSIMKSNNMDTVKEFPPIRVFGTVGFIAAMWFVNFVKFGLEEAAQFTYMQLIVSGTLGLILGLFCFTLPQCPLSKSTEKKSFIQMLGLDAFVLFKQKKMALFFIFSMLLGVSLQITNGFATPYINSFAAYSDSWFAENPTLLVSISQIAEALCILMIPFCMKRFGIKNVMLMAMFAWVLRFGFFGIGTTENIGGIICLFASCIVYGVAFDFFNVSGALFVEQQASKPMQASAQGLFMLMTNGIGASVGTWIAGKIVYANCSWQPWKGDKSLLLSIQDKGLSISGLHLDGWQTSWFIFAAYALVVAVLFWIFFRYKEESKK